MYPDKHLKKEVIAQGLALALGLVPDHDRLLDRGKKIGVKNHQAAEVKNLHADGEAAIKRRKALKRKSGKLY